MKIIFSKIHSHHQFGFFILFLFMISSCTQKYTSYDVIGKLHFEKKNYQVPTVVYPLKSVGRDELSSCFNQWLFFSNAEKKKNEAFDWMIKSLCPGENYLLETDVRESWWTVIFFSRACVKIKTTCGALNK